MDEQARAEYDHFMQEEARVEYKQAERARREHEEMMDYENFLGLDRDYDMNMEQHDDHAN